MITVKLFGLEWEPRRLLAVLLATLGVIAVVYGGSIAGRSEEYSAQQSHAAALATQPSAPLVGDLLTLVASVAYALYQVLYKKYATPSIDPKVVSEDSYEQLPNEDPVGLHSESASLNAINRPSVVHSPPFGFYANFLTCTIGLLTFLFMWLPIPFLHYSGAELFRPPSNMITVLVIAGISLTGMIFNAGLMAS